MGEGTSMHDNERFGLSAFFSGSTINVYQPCVLNDMSHGNENVGTVQQKDPARNIKKQQDNNNNSRINEASNIL